MRDESPSIDGIDMISGDVMNLPFPDASFDAIYASALLQHLPDPLGALGEARRVARPGAVIGVVDAGGGGGGVGEEPIWPEATMDLPCTSDPTLVSTTGSRTRQSQRGTLHASSTAPAEA